MFHIKKCVTSDLNVFKYASFVSFSDFTSVSESNSFSFYLKGSSLSEGPYFLSIFKQ